MVLQLRVLHVAVINRIRLLNLIQYIQKPRKKKKKKKKIKKKKFFSFKYCIIYYKYRFIDYIYSKEFKN